MMCVFLRCVQHDVDKVVFSPECLAVVRLLLLSADASVLPTASVSGESTVSSPHGSRSVSGQCVSSLPGGSVNAGLMQCVAVRRCLLPLADVLLSAGTHVYLSTTKLHRAMLMMVVLTNELKPSRGWSFTVVTLCCVK